MLSPRPLTGTLPRSAGAWLLAVVLAAGGCAADDGPASEAVAAPGAPVSSAPGTAPPAASTAPAPTHPVTVRTCGRDVTYERAPQRVLLGFPTSITTLASLGVADRAVGYVTGSAAKPPAGFAGLPEVSPDYQPSREAVIAARPDLFLSNDENQLAGESGVTSGDLETMKAGLYVLGGYCAAGPAPVTVDAVMDDIRALGRIFGVADTADRLTGELQRRVAAAASLRGDRPAARVAFVQVYDGKLYALSGSYYAAVLAGAGLANEFADVSENFAEISAEEVLTRRPEVLVVAYEGEDAAGAVADAKRRLANTPAVTGGRVIALRSADISGGGIGVVDVIEQVARGAYGS